MSLGATAVRNQENSVAGMIKNLMFFLPALLFMGLSGLLGFALLYGSGDAGGARLGKEIPEFELPLLGSTVLLSRQDLPQNRALLLNLWGSWCHSCAVEHAELARIAASGVPVIGINYRDLESDALRWLEQHGDFYAFHIVDRQGMLALALGATGAPETWLVGKDGTILLHHIGIMNATVWQRQFVPALQLSGVAGDSARRSN